MYTVNFEIIKFDILSSKIYFDFFYYGHLEDFYFKDKTKNITFMNINIENKCIDF
jgi:hypothetical protein